MNLIFLKVSAKILTGKFRGHIVFNIAFTAALLRLEMKTVFTVCLMTQHSVHQMLKLFCKTC